MNYIQDKYTLEIFEALSGENDLGRAMTYNGKAGRMKNFYNASKDRWCPYFNPDGIEFVGDSVLLDLMMDASNDFTSVATATITPPPVDCADPINIIIGADDVYKNLNTDGTTNIKLTLTSANPLDEYQVSTKKSGAGETNGLDGSGNPVHWLTVAKGSNGFYNIKQPSTGVAEPIWIRKLGCTGNSYLVSYVTFNSDGSDPLFPSGGGSGTDAVYRAKPLYIKVWGFYSGRNDPDFGIAGHKHKIHYMEQSAMSGVNRSGVPFKPQRPFYAIDGYYTKDSNGNIITNSGSRTVPCGLWSNVIGDFVVENRFADTDWQMNQAVMDSCINYVVASGLQYFNFEYYPNGDNGSLMRNLFEQNNNKRGVKAAYSIGLLGGNPSSYPDPNDDYTKNLNHLVWAMGQAWYQKIGTQPIINYFYQRPSSDPTILAAWRNEKLAEINRVRARYNEVYPSNSGLYEVHVTDAADPDMSDATFFGINKKSWYYAHDENLSGTHNMDSGNNLAVSVCNSITSSGAKCQPSLNLAMDGRARAMYPTRTYQWNNFNTSPSDLDYKGDEIGAENSYYTTPTETQVKNYIDQMIALLAGSNVDTGGFATWDEMSEGGEGCLMPKRRIDGSINDSQVRWFRDKLNPDYVL